MGRRRWYRVHLITLHLSAGIPPNSVSNSINLYVVNYIVCDTVKITIVKDKVNIEDKRRVYHSATRTEPGGQAYPRRS